MLLFPDFGMREGGDGGGGEREKNARPAILNKLHH